MFGLVSKKKYNELEDARVEDQIRYANTIEQLRTEIREITKENSELTKKLAIFEAEKERRSANARRAANIRHHKGE